MRFLRFRLEKQNIFLRHLNQYLLHLFLMIKTECDGIQEQALDKIFRYTNID